MADITYVRLPTTFCQLASIIDDFSRQCVGWHLSRWIDTRLTLGALSDGLEVSLSSRGIDPPLRSGGAEYASGEYIAHLEEQIGARISMAAVGNPQEKAKAESFFRRTSKMEEVYL